MWTEISYYSRPITRVSMLMCGLSNDLQKPYFTDLLSSFNSYYALSFYSLQTVSLQGHSLTLRNPLSVMWYVRNAGGERAARAFPSPQRRKRRGGGTP